MSLKNLELNALCNPSDNLGTSSIFGILFSSTKQQGSTVPSILSLA
jgi:hypothetical protein